MNGLDQGGEYFTRVVAGMVHRSSQGPASGISTGVGNDQVFSGSMFWC